MFFRLSDQSRGLAFSFGWDSNITANFQVPLCQATARRGEGQEGRWWQGEGGCCWVVLCCLEKDRVLPEWGQALQVKSICSWRSAWTNAWTNEDETCDKREHGTKGNGRQSTVIFSLDTAVPHAPSFTGFPSLNALSAEGCGAFTVRLCWGPAFMNHVLGEVQGRAYIHRADFVNTGKPPGWWDKCHNRARPPLAVWSLLVLLSLAQNSSWYPGSWQFLCGSSCSLFWEDVTMPSTGNPSQSLSDKIL